MGVASKTPRTGEGMPRRGTKGFIYPSLAVKLAHATVKRSVECAEPFPLFYPPQRIIIIYLRPLRPSPPRSPPRTRLRRELTEGELSLKFKQTHIPLVCFVRTINWRVN